MTQPIALHYWPTPNGHKITIVLEELGLPYKIHPVNIGVGDQFKPEFLKISPNNRMPAMVDPDGPGGAPVSIFESGAILRYLANKAGALYGDDARTAIVIDEWLFWQVGGLGPMLGQANHFRNYARGVTNDQRQLAYAANRYTNEAHRLFGVLERQLEARDHVAGDYSIADIACWPWVNAWQSFGIVIAEFPNVAAWLKRIGDRPAVVKAMALGDQVKAGSLRGTPEQQEEARKVLFRQQAR